MHWFEQLRRRTQRAWNALPDREQEGPLLDSSFLRQLEVLSLRVGRGNTTGFAGEHASRRQAHSVEFSDYRDYRPGDDFRLIDWNVYARLGELTLRLTEATEATTLHLLLDCSASMAWGRPAKFRTMQRLAAALGCIALSRYDSVSMAMLQEGNAHIFPRFRGKNDIDQLLKIVSTLRPQGGLDLRAAVTAYCGVPRRGVGLLIGDLLAPHGALEAAAMLRRAGLSTTVIQMLAREECTPILEGVCDLVDAETGETVTTVISDGLLRAYAGRFAAWTAQLQEGCATQQIAFVRCYTDQPLEDALFGVLRGQVVQ